MPERIVGKVKPSERPICHVLRVRDRRDLKATLNREVLGLTRGHAAVVCSSRRVYGESQRADRVRVNTDQASARVKRIRALCRSAREGTPAQLEPVLCQS